MKFIGLLIATLLVPILPWIFLVGPMVVRKWDELMLILLAVAGLILDLWWGTPLGLTSLFLLGLTLLVQFVGRWWPSNQRVYVIVVGVVSLIAMELYLAVV